MTWFPNWVVPVLSSFCLSDNTDFDTNVTFRQVGIKNPGTTAVAFAGYGIKAEDGAGDYTVGETITQELTVNGETKAAKGLVSWDSTNDVVKYIQDPKLHTDTDGIPIFSPER